VPPADHAPGDKPFIAADPDGSGALYLTWTAQPEAPPPLDFNYVWMTAACRHGDEFFGDLPQIVAALHDAAEFTDAGDAACLGAVAAVLDGK